MAPAKLNPTSRPLSPSTTAIDTPKGSFSIVKTSGGLIQQKKSAAGSNKSVSSRSSSPHPDKSIALANMSSTSAASGGWFGWGKSAPAAAKRTTHTRSKSWFGGGKNETSSKRDSVMAANEHSVTEPSATGQGHSAKFNTAVDNLTCSSDNNTSGNPGSNTPPTDIATESTPDQASQEKEEGEEVQHRAPYPAHRNLSMEELRSFKYKSGRQHLQAENTSLKEQLRNSFDAMLLSHKERDHARVECRKSQGTVKQLEKDVSSLHVANHELRVESTSLRESREALERKISSMYTTIDELKADSTSFKEAKGLEISSLHTSIFELKSEITSLKEREFALSSSQQTLETTLRTLQQDLDAANARITSLLTQESMLQSTLHSAQAALTEEKIRSRETESRLEERRAFETYLRTELEKSQSLALAHAKDLEKLREDHIKLQIATAAPLAKKHKITKNDSQKLSEQNAELTRQLQHARQLSKQLSIDLAALDRQSEVDAAAKSKFSLRDIVRRPRPDTAKGEEKERPRSSYGKVKEVVSRPLTSRGDRRSIII